MHASEKEAISLDRVIDNMNLRLKALAGARFPKRVVREDYLFVPEHGIIIGRNEEHADGLPGQIKHYLGVRELSMPSPSHFMSHLIDVISAYNGARELYDANGRELGEEEVRIRFNQLMENCGTCLDASFLTLYGKLHMETNTRIKKNGDRYNSSSVTELVLPHFAMGSSKGGFVGLHFNEQGLPVTNPRVYLSGFESGVNVCYSPPKNGRCAIYTADEDGAHLDFSWRPSHTSKDIGVFACAEPLGDGINFSVEVPDA